MDKLTVFTPKIVRHSVIGLKMTRLKISGQSGTASKFQREGKAVLIAAGFSLAIWVAIAMAMLNKP